MLNLSSVRCLDLDSRLLAVETIKDADDQRKQNSR